MYDQILKPNLEKSHAIINHVNTSTRQHVNTSTHQHINTSTHQHIKNSVRKFTRLSSALLLGSFLLGGSNSWAQSVNYTVATGNTFSMASVPPLGGVSGCVLVTGTHYYVSQQFTVPSNATYTIETTSSAMTFSGQPDTFIAIYNTAFNPASPTTGLIACDDDAGTGYLSKVTPALVTGTTYTIVITSFYATTSTAVLGNGGSQIITGAVTASFTPNVTLGAATGGSGGGSTPVSAPIDLHFSKQVETFATEIEIK